MTQVLIDRDTLEKALKLAFNLGQTYWEQADSDYVSQQNKSNGTREKFNQLITDTCAALAIAEPAGWQKIETAPEGTMILCANMKAMDARSWAYVAWIAGGKVYGHRMDMPTHWKPLPTPPKEQQ